MADVRIKFEGTACPDNDGGTIKFAGGWGNVIASVATGQAFTAFAKALVAMGKGARGGWFPLTCTTCHKAFVGCDICEHIWRPSAAPSHGDTVTCPQCGNQLV